MVTFAKEQCISPQRLAKRLGVSTDTIRRWFRQGLEKRKVGGKVFTSLEALDRFSDSPLAIADNDHRHRDAMETLARMGVKPAMEAITDVKAQRVGAVA